MLLAIMAFAGAASLGAGDWPLFALVCVGSGLAMGADLTIPASLVADLGEGKGRTASYFGIWNLIAKFNLALAAGVALPLLGWFDYAPGQGGNPQVLVMTYVLLPLSLKLCAMVLLWRWREPLAFKN
jgi:Na+/melibiose symporter-like transporter